jgi:hypothetical protein
MLNAISHLDIRTCEEIKENILDMALNCTGKSTYALSKYNPRALPLDQPVWCEDNIKMSLRERVREVRKYMEVVQDRDQWRVLVLSVYYLWSY